MSIAFIVLHFTTSKSALLASAVIANLVVNINENGKLHYNYVSLIFEPMVLDNLFEIGICVLDCYMLEQNCSVYLSLFLVNLSWL